MAGHFLPVDTGDEPVELLLCERPCAVAVTRPGEAPLVQTAGAEPDAVFIPPQQFDAGAVFIGEEEGGTVVSGHAERVLHIYREDISATAHIDGMADEEESLRLQHVSPPGERQEAVREGSRYGIRRGGAA